MQSRLQLFCKAIMEAAWLAAAAVIPLFFNISSFRIFELEKMSVLRFLVIISSTAWLLARFDAGWRGLGSQFKSFLRNPLVKPVLALGTVYVLSSIFSVAPVVSWWGLYKRAQGTMAFFCYGILFLTVLSELRTNAQARRLQFVFILTSIPVSAYAILQYLGVSFVPLSGWIQERPVGSMGNPIFLGGYLVMLIPPTFCQLLEGFKGLRSGLNRRPGIVLIGCCSIALLLQCFALVKAQSRGPALGLVISAYLCPFIFLVMNRTKQRDRLGLYAVTAGIGLVAPVFLIVVARLTAGNSAEITLACIAAATALIAAVYLCVWLTPWGRGRLWLAWIAQSITLALIFSNPVGLAQGLSSFTPSLGHLAQWSDAKSSDRRTLWETAVHSMRSGPPAILPDGTHDPYHFLRPLIGYGPECVSLTANAYAVPFLARPNPDFVNDRMHNETFDNLITIGSAGAAAFLFIIAAGFYYSLRYLGLISESRGKTAFVVLSGSGCLGGILVPWIAGAPDLIAMGVTLGLVTGAFVFVAWTGFRNPDSGSEGKTQPLFVLGILGALIAHFIETTFGVAITPTRVYFYLFLAALAVLCTRNLADNEERAKKRAASPERRFRNPLLPYASLSPVSLPAIKNDILRSWA